MTLRITITHGRGRDALRASYMLTVNGRESGPHPYRLLVDALADMGDATPLGTGNARGHVLDAFVAGSTSFEI